MTDVPVEALEERRRRALLSGDAAELARLMDEDCVYIHSSGFIDSGRNMIDKIERGDVRYHRLDFADESVHHLPTTTVFVYRQIADMELKGLPHGSDTLCSAVWATDAAGGARLISFHSAFMERAA
ncbi:MAG: nuclear transport factor 2 family protein [Microbacterium sp.]|uniref:nuclear transport factor 2 family protein n=1 Tax=Microbacterium sp. TaxID=51671 RepID=UPI0039E27CB8